MLQTRRSASDRAAAAVRVQAGRGVPVAAALVTAQQRQHSSATLSWRQHQRCQRSSCLRAPRRDCRTPLPSTNSARQSRVMAASQAEGPSPDKTNVLFVCLGNICRSPSAEAVFKAVVEREGVADRFFIDSCGTGGGNPDWYHIEDSRGWSYHEGDQADPRMREAAARRNMNLTSRSRPLAPDDFRRFDFIVGMDAQNLAAIEVAANHWAATHENPAGDRNKVTKMTSYLRDERFKQYDEVPDPYFAAPGRTDGFDLVLDLLEDACEGLLEQTGVTQPANS